MYDHVRRIYSHAGGAVHRTAGAAGVVSCHGLYINGKIGTKHGVSAFYDAAAAAAAVACHSSLYSCSYVLQL